MLIVRSLGEGGFRLTSDRGRESLLSRYGILKNELRRSYSKTAALTLDGKTVAEYILPEVYRTETRFAVRFAEDVGEGELKVSCPDGTELEKADVWIFKNPTV